VTNTLAYYEHCKITAAKSSITLGPGANVIKLFLSVIYGFSHKASVSQTRPEKLTNDKHSNLLRKLVNYGRKKFYNIAARKRKTFVRIFFKSFVIEKLFSNLVFTGHSLDDLFSFFL
jgi:predicted nucleotide-binding protein (sugar kinase/HSP70/actin superfamily)